jgi:hypothetical protein
VFVLVLVLVFVLVLVLVLVLVAHSKQITYCPPNTTTIFYIYYGRKQPKHVAITKLKRTHICVRHTVNYSGADKSLRRPATEDFNVYISYLLS